jgi:hypothetical protein
MPHEKVRFVLSEIFENAAIWHSMLPRHDRTAEAGEIFRKLAVTVDQIEDESLSAYAELWAGELDRLAHRQQLKSMAIGLLRPASASEFVSRFIAERTGGGEN